MPYTFPVVPIDFADQAPDGQIEGIYPGLPPAASQVIYKGTLVQITAGAVEHLTNADVTNLALALEDSPDPYNRAAGVDLPTAKPRVGISLLRGRNIIMSTLGGAWAANRVGVSYGVKKNAAGISYIDFADTTTVAVKVLGLFQEQGVRGFDGTKNDFVIPAIGDTGVRVICRVIDSACYVL